MFKRKTLLERWDDNYAGIPVPANNKKGFKVKYVYYGPWYVWNLEENELKKEKLTDVGLSVAGLILYFIFALVNTPLNMKALVVIPGMAAEAIHLIELVADVRFLTAPHQVNRMTFEDIDNVFKMVPKIRAYLLAAAAVFGVIYLPFGSFSVESVLVILANVLCAYMALTIHKRYSRLTSRIEKNRTLETMERLDLDGFEFSAKLPDFVRNNEERREEERKENRVNDIPGLPDFVKNAMEKEDTAETNETKPVEE